MQQDREVPGSIPADATPRYKSVQAMELQVCVGRYLGTDKGMGLKADTNA